MTQRRRLDAFLAEKAEEAGAEFPTGSKATGGGADGDGVAVARRRRDGTGADALGADGVNGIERQGARPRRQPHGRGSQSRRTLRTRSSTRSAIADGS